MIDTAERHRTITEGAQRRKGTVMKKNPEITNTLYELFKCIVKLNQYRFKDMHVLTAVEYLAEFADLDYSLVDEDALKELIAEYADEHDTGIYY